jgi:hypothetical protein
MPFLKNNLSNSSLVQIPAFVDLATGETCLKNGLVIYPVFCLISRPPAGCDWFLN